MKTSRIIIFLGHLTNAGNLVDNKAKVLSIREGVAARIGTAGSHNIDPLEVTSLTLLL